MIRSNKTHPRTLWGKTHSTNSTVVNSKKCIAHQSDRWWVLSDRLTYFICYRMQILITLGNKKFRDVKMSRGICRTAPHGWFSQIFVLTQVESGGKVSILAIVDVF